MIKLIVFCHPMLIINSYDIITFTGVTQCIHKHPHLVLGQDQHLTKLRVRNPTENLIFTVLYLVTV